MDFTRLIESYGYLGIVLGSILDGETSVILAGMAAGHGALSFTAIVLLAALVNFAWDQFYFWLGRRRGSALIGRYPRLQPGFERTARILERHQTFFIVGMRFMVGLRVAGPIALGVARVRPAVFATLNAIGALVWAIAFTSFGYLCAKGIDVLALASMPLLTLAAAVLVACGLVWAARCHLRARRVPNHAALGV